MAAAKLQITLPNTHTEWQGGSMESIKWKSVSGKLSGRVSIELLEGPDPSNLSTVSTIAENIPASNMQSFWSVPQNLKESKNYAIKVVDEDGEEYYGQFFKAGSSKSDSGKKTGKSATSKDQAPAHNTKPEASADAKASGSQDRSRAENSSNNASQDGTKNESKPLSGSSQESSAIDSKPMHKEGKSANSAARASGGIFAAAVACAVGAAF
ncbi:hypothetical protein GGF43_005211 [Coemansia sp. RSA 2618]|nr:hypothetical protein GGF43_005211 [Coemansia sp. RSA 2618]